MAKGAMEKYLQSMEHHIRKTELPTMINTLAFIYLTVTLLTFTYFSERGLDPDTAIAS